MGVSKAIAEKQKVERLGEERLNKQGYLMKIVEYNNSKDIIVEFQDATKERVHTNYKAFVRGEVENRLGRLYEENTNHEGCLMKIIQYNRNTDIVVEFQDEYKAQVHTQYTNFKRKNVKNPYYPSVCGVGITGNKCPTWNNGKHAKEYDAWQNMLLRCYDSKVKKKYPTYQDVTCCKEWLFYENFYEWLHSQENFDKWYNNEQWHLDKDILVKGNKMYSPETCCLVPYNVNKLFISSKLRRGSLPIGVTKGTKKQGYIAKVTDSIDNTRSYIGYHKTPEEAFNTYKIRKEESIKKVADFEYSNGNITQKCYEAMLNYKIEITD